MRWLTTLGLPAKASLGFAALAAPVAITVALVATSGGSGSVTSLPGLGGDGSGHSPSPSASASGLPSASPSGSPTASPSVSPSASASASASPAGTPGTSSAAPPASKKPAPRRAAPRPPAPVQRPGGRPGPANTGVPAGTRLTVHAGNITVTRTGTVINGWHITGSLLIKASNVRVLNSLIDGDGSQASVRVFDGYSGILIQDTEVRVLHPVRAVDAMSVRGATLNRLNIHGGVDGMKLSSNSVVENSWIHGLRHVGSSHNDSIQIMSGSNITVRNNYLQAVRADNAAIQVTQDTGTTRGLVISGNWADGGGCTFNFSDHGPNGTRLTLNGISVIGNRFGYATSNFGCPILISTRTTISSSGNVYYNSSQAVRMQQHD